MSKSEAARRFGVSLRTIYRWIESGEVDGDPFRVETGYGPRGPARHMLDPCSGIIDARLAEYPLLSAFRLFDEVREAGYPGGYGRVRDHVRSARPSGPAAPAAHFETPPGQQRQVDFGMFTLPWGRRHALLVVLGHARLPWLRFHARQTIAVLTEGLERAFARFGGLPRELLFD